MLKKPTRLKKPVKKRYKINKALCEKIKKNIAQINSLIFNLKVLKQYKFLFLLLTVTPISVLGQSEPNRIRYTT
jgi:aromatic ring-opening dioxygenase LigB subunit